MAHEASPPAAARRELHARIVPTTLLYAAAEQRRALPLRVLTRPKKPRILAVWRCRARVGGRRELSGRALWGPGTLPLMFVAKAEADQSRPDSSDYRHDVQQAIQAGRHAENEVRHSGTRQTERPCERAGFRGCYENAEPVVLDAERDQRDPGARRRSLRPDTRRSGRRSRLLSRS